jgi:hypothetical protein
MIPPPLQYVDFPLVLEVLRQQAQNKILGSLFPQDLNDAFAVALSEGASGFVGGAAAKAASYIDGNTNSKDTTLTNAGASGVFFAIRGGLRSVFELVGTSSLVFTLTSSFLAFTISEIVKLRGRAISQQQTRVGDGPTMLELMRYRDPSMKALMNFRESEKQMNSISELLQPPPKKESKGMNMQTLMKFREVEKNINNVKRFPRRNVAVESRASLKQKPPSMPIISEFPINAPMLATSTPRELLSDVMKWFVYTSIIPDVAYVPLVITLNCGALAGIVSQLVKEDRQTQQRLTLPIPESEDTAILRVSRAAFEGATQFFTYEVTRQWLLGNIPNPDRLLHTFNDFEGIAASLTL